MKQTLLFLCNHFLEFYSTSSHILCSSLRVHFISYQMRLPFCGKWRCKKIYITPAGSARRKWMKRNEILLYKYSSTTCRDVNYLCFTWRHEEFFNYDLLRWQDKATRLIFRTLNNSKNSMFVSAITKHYQVSTATHSFLSFSPLHQVYFELPTHTISATLPLYRQLTAQFHSLIPRSLTLYSPVGIVSPFFSSIFFFILAPLELNQIMKQMAQNN